ncbi:MAG: hypothetical protein AAGC46_00755 [Solirubrobacteraceae bacterium]|nr:hypothetical protein [Patulibacter sp.]
MRRRLPSIAAAWLLLLVALPALAYLFGVRQPLLLNREPAPFPAVNRSSLPNKAIYPRFDAAILDRLPLRQYALQFRGLVAVRLFAHSSNDAVVIGKHGWQFYRQELRACEDAPPDVTDPVDAADSVARSIVASGRTGGLVIAGSKVVAERANTPASIKPQVDCVAALERAVHDRLADAPGGIDLEGRLGAIRRAGNDTFLKHDTHWNGLGREEFVRATLDAIRPGLADAAGLTLSKEKVRHAGDLGKLLGVPERDATALPQVARTPAHALAPGTVALVGDSQFEEAYQAPAPNGPSIQARALPGQRSCTVNAVEAGTCDALMRGSRAVIQEMVGRGLRDFTNGCWRTVSVMGETMRGPAGRWQAAPEIQGAGGTLALGAAGVIVKATLPGGDVSKTPRLIRIPIQTLPPAPAGQPASVVGLGEVTESGDQVTPCNSQTQSVQGRALIITVPAGRKVSDLKIVLTAPAGTVIGRPQEIVLDGHDASR